MLQTMLYHYQMLKISMLWPLTPAGYAEFCVQKFNAFEFQSKLIKKNEFFVVSSRKAWGYLQ